jgi:hypothetical protein
MKLRTLLTTAVALAVLFSLGGQLMAQEAARQDFSAIYVGPANSKPSPSDTIAGFGIGTIGMYTPITGTPCFSCFGLPTGAMAIGPAVSVATQGTGYTWYFTVQTNSSTSGNIRVLMRLLQGGTLIGTPLAGTLSFNANSVYIVYSTLPVVTPNNPGTAFAIVGLQQGNAATQAEFAPIVIE